MKITKIIADTIDQYNDRQKEKFPLFFKLRKTIFHFNIYGVFFFGIILAMYCIFLVGCKFLNMIFGICEGFLLLWQQVVYLIFFTIIFFIIPSRIILKKKT